jgi:hypothetical protein
MRDQTEGEAAGDRICRCAGERKPQGEQEKCAGEKRAEETKRGGPGAAQFSNAE